MKKLFRAAAYMALAALILFAPAVSSRLPVRSDEVVKKAYDSWSGVLRIWVCEGYEVGNGSLTGWLYACTSRFEKKHPGVYVQLRAVSAATLAAFHEGDVPPPDLILYAPGMLSSTEGLKALDSSYDALKPALRGMGYDRDARYAVPVAMGGYGWLVNRAMLSELPDDFGLLPQPTPGVRSAKRKTALYVMDAPADSAYVSWSAALISLLSELSPSTGEERKPLAGEGLDLGLSIPATPLPESTSSPNAGQFVYSDLPAELPDKFRQSPSVYSSFTNGILSVIPATQREIRRISLLSESGRAPDYTVKAAGACFTDQLTLISAVEQHRENGEARESVSLKLISHLLSEPSQQSLVKSRAFPVTTIAPVYASDPDMTEMEVCLTSGKLLICPAFDASWREKASRLADRLQAGDIGTREAMQALKNALAS